MSYDEYGYDEDAFDDGEEKGFGEFGYDEEDEKDAGDYDDYGDEFEGVGEEQFVSFVNQQNYGQPQRSPERGLGTEIAGGEFQKIEFILDKYKKQNSPDEYFLQNVRRVISSRDFVWGFDDAERKEMTNKSRAESFFHPLFSARNAHAYALGFYLNKAALRSPALKSVTKYIREQNAPVNINQCVLYARLWGSK